MLTLFKKIKKWYLDLCNIPLIDLILMNVVVFLISVSFSKGDKLLTLFLYFTLLISVYTVYIKEDNKNATNNK